MEFTLIMKVNELFTQDPWDCEELLFCFFIKLFSYNPVLMWWENYLQYNIKWNLIDNLKRSGKSEERWFYVQVNMRNMFQVRASSFNNKNISDKEVCRYFKHATCIFYVYVHKIHKTR